MENQENEISLNSIAGDILDAGYSQLQQMKNAYEADKVKPELNNYTPEGKKKYYIDLSDKYLKKAKGLRKQVADRVIDRLDHEKELISERQQVEEIKKKEHIPTTNELLQRNNSLLYATNVLQNGTPNQVLQMLNNNSDDMVLNLISMKVNNLKNQDKEDWLRVINKLDDIKKTPLDVIKQVRNGFYAYYCTDNNKFPSNHALSVDIGSLFDSYTNAMNKFFL